jgi:hypothetical protein
MAVAVLVCTGCAHARGDDIINTVLLGAVIALDVAQYEPPPEPLCDDDDSGNPPHTCPGSGAGVTPPPPPPDP